MPDRDAKVDAYTGPKPDDLIIVTTTGGTSCLIRASDMERYKYQIPTYMPTGERVADYFNRTGQGFSLPVSVARETLKWGC